VKNAIILVFCLLATSIAVFGQTRDCVAPNATWLHYSEDSFWTHYEISSTDDGWVLRLDQLAENVKIYTARLESEKDWSGDHKRVNVADLDENRFWLCPFDKNRPYDYVSYWYGLSEKGSNNLILNQLLGKTLYIDTGNGTWYSVSVFRDLADHSSVIPESGLIKVRIYESRLESDIYQCSSTN